MIRAFATCVLTVATCLVGICEAGERIALVIGNSKYADGAELRNPTNDADAVEIALKALDFEVVTSKDLNLEQLDDAIINFCRKLGKGKVGLFYYAGHGLQVKGENYLVPLGAKLQEESQVKYQCYAVDQILESMAESECSLKMLVLDSCRNNPFKRSWTRGGADGGLAAISEVPDGTIIAFSTSQGSTASDGSGNNSPFTEQLVRVLALRDQSLEVTQAIRLTAQALKKQTGQSPWFHQDAAMEPYYLWQVSASGTSTAATTAVPLVTSIAKPTIPTMSFANQSPDTGSPLPSITNSIGMKLTLIPAGEFQMGGNPDPLFVDVQPQHRVRITKPFHMGIHEVTQGQWQAVMATTPWSGETSNREGTDYPACNMNWDEAKEFCRKLSAREQRQYDLPTEAQWEYACRAGTTTKYSFGDDESLRHDYASYVDPLEFFSSSNPESYVNRVGTKRPNPWGLYDMHGNVTEWCDDWYDAEYYRTSRVDDPAGFSSGSTRVTREGIGSAERSNHKPDFQNALIGFRVVLVP